MLSKPPQTNTPVHYKTCPFDLTHEMNTKTYTRTGNIKMCLKLLIRSRQNSARKVKENTILTYYRQAGFPSKPEAYFPPRSSTWPALGSRFEEVQNTRDAQEMKKHAVKNRIPFSNTFFSLWKNSHDSDNGKRKNGITFCASPQFFGTKSPPVSWKYTL